MPKFDKRRVNQHTLSIIRDTGRVIGCYQQISGFPDPTNRIPIDPFTADSAEIEADYKLYYIFAYYEEVVQEEMPAEGEITSVIGKLTVPRIYQAKLAATTYFDPYLNGSRFAKYGAVQDSQDIMIYQTIKSVTLPKQGVE
jgi:hypothetical protein